MLFLPYQLNFHQRIPWFYLSISQLQAFCFERPTNNEFLLPSLKSCFSQTTHLIDFAKVSFNISQILEELQLKKSDFGPHTRERWKARMCRFFSIFGNGNSNFAKRFQIEVFIQIFNRQYFEGSSYNWNINFFKTAVITDAKKNSQSSIFCNAISLSFRISYLFSTDVISVVSSHSQTMPVMLTLLNVSAHSSL